MNDDLLTRRDLLKRTLGAGAVLGFGLPSRLSSQTSNAPAPSSPSVALALARFLNRVKFTDLPPGAIEHAKMILASTLASAASGTHFESARIVRDLAKEQGGRPQAPIWFDRAKLPLNDAARVNAMLSDAAASDDSDLRNVAHTGTTLTAVGLAVAEHTRSTGQQVLAAMVAGYEAAGRIGEALAGRGRGFHASTIVAFGGVVTAGRLLGLTDEQLAQAISLTATTVGGLAMGTDSWAREYHAGNAALTAVNAALAAARGFTANEDMLESPRGFLQVFGDAKVDVGGITRDLGKEWDIVTHLAIKLVPGAHAFHPTVEAAVNAAREANVPPEQIAKILLSGGQSRTIVRGARPKDFVEAIHSLSYFVASAVADRDFSWVHATPEKIGSPVVARLIDLIEQDPAPSPVRYNWSWGGTVTLVTKSGNRYTSTVDAPRGSGPRGIEWKDVERKYHDLMPDAGMQARRIDQVLAVIHRFQEAANASELNGLLTRS
jgi:2-methylcitrate dehydratase PrpD